MTAAACEGLITFLEIEGLEGITGGEFADQSEIRRRRKRTERRVQLIMTGAESGLSEATITALRQWDDLFDLETHGGRPPRPCLRDG